MSVLHVLVIFADMFGLCAAAGPAAKGESTPSSTLELQGRQLQKLQADESALLQSERPVNRRASETKTTFSEATGWGPLSHRYCQWAFQQKQHVFHGMWAARGQLSAFTNALSNGRYKQTCWQSMQMTPDVYIGAVRHQNVSGLSCVRNWNDPKPASSGPAAILGYGSDIASACGMVCSSDNASDCQLNCSSAKVVVLDLHGQGMAEWNMCRNFEFVTCAAMGALPGQKQPLILLATPPSDMWPDKIMPWAQEAWMAGAEAYPTMHIITLLEMCMLDMMCSNHDELFNAKNSSYFRCVFNERGYRSIGAHLASHRNQKHLTSRK